MKAQEPNEDTRYNRAVCTAQTKKSEQQHASLLNLKSLRLSLLSLLDDVDGLDPHETSFVPNNILARSSSSSSTKNDFAFLNEKMTEDEGSPTLPERNKVPGPKIDSRTAEAQARHLARQQAARRKKQAAAADPLFRQQRKGPGPGGRTAQESQQHGATIKRAHQRQQQRTTTMAAPQKTIETIPKNDPVRQEDAVVRNSKADLIEVDDGSTITASTEIMTPTSSPQRLSPGHHFKVRKRSRCTMPRLVQGASARVSRQYLRIEEPEKANRLLRNLSFPCVLRVVRT